MLFIYFFLISFSLIGYGLLINKALKINIYNFGCLGLMGISFLTTISYASSLFIPHSYIFNISIILFGILMLIIFNKEITHPKKEILNFVIIFGVLLIFILIGKTHDDFPYYHFAYSQLITEYPHPIGMGQLNNGFRHPSSLFFLSSMFYLPKISFYLFHIAPAYFLGFANLFLLRNIFDKNIFQDLKFINLLNLIFFIFINIFFYRLSEHGTDRSGLILVICMIISLFTIINASKKSFFDVESNIKFFGIILCLLISLKPFYLIYAPFFLVLLLNKDTRNIVLRLLISRTFIYCLLFVFFIFFFTFINSGCIIFPLSFTCFDNLYWSTSIKTVEGVRTWYELWAKGGANPHYFIENKKEYISGLNWISNWMDIYFFNKVSDFLLSLLLLFIVFYLTFFLKNRNNVFKKNNNSYLIVYLLIFLSFIEWFMNHPTLRYGGYHLIPFILYVPLCLYLSNFNFSLNFFNKRALILILITLIIFVGRNFSRLIKEHNQYNYNPLVSTKYKINYDLLFNINRHFKISLKGQDGLTKYKEFNFLGNSFIIIND
tara:strand:- start:1364 stop:3004 length:1641 start_codon:yes stop_codon:yes gene_type:complete